MNFFTSLSRRVKIIIAACAVAAAAVAVAVTVLNPEEAYRVIKVFELNGSAAVARENTGDISAYEGMNLENGDVLSVEAKSDMSMSLDSNKYIFLEGGTVLGLVAQGSSEDSKTVIDLREGKIRNEIKEPLSENSTYEVHTPKVTIAVRGTVFEVTAAENTDGSYVTDVYTAEGKVSVQLYDEDGEKKGDETFVPESGAVTILTEVNGETGNPADVDGDPHFVYRTDDGSFLDCGDSDPVYYPDDPSPVVDAAAMTTAETTAETTVETTSETTVETTVETTAEEEPEEEIYELENKTVKWFSHYDPFGISSPDIEPSYAAEQFESRYGGRIEYIPTTWDNRYNDLSALVLGGEGVDFLPADFDSLFPYGAVSGLLQPMDPYVDYDSEIWKDVRDISDRFYINGGHYITAVGIQAGNVVIYNRRTIRENGFEDPARLLEEGKWNWDTFREMLLKFVDNDSGRCGLDGWDNESALMLSGGVPSVEIKDGLLVHNLYDPNLERSLDYMYDLNVNGLIFDKSLTNWQIHPEYIGQSKELFYISGIYEFGNPPEVWTGTFGNAGDVMFVPVPKDPSSDAYYLNAGMEAYMLCKGAQNPEGVAKFLECLRESYVKEISVYYHMGCGWTDEMIEMNKKIETMTAENPVFDIYKGCPKEMASLIDSSEQGVRAPFNGVKWADIRDPLAEAVDGYVKEFNDSLS